MNEELKQQVSDFLDNELDHAAALHLLEKIRNDQALSDTFNRYALIGEALKNNQILPITSDFTAKISARIGQEPHYLIPKRKPSKYHRQVWAVAASIAVVAVITSQNLDKHAPDSSGTSIQLAQQMPPPKNAPTARNNSQTEQYPLNARINDYLQAHNSSIYSNGQAEFRPLAKVTAYSNQK